MALASVTVRRATEEDAAAIALAHLDSIRSLGARFYPPDVVAAWSEGLTPSLYRDAMRGGEAFLSPSANSKVSGCAGLRDASR